VGPVLKTKGVLFAGLDIIGDYLTEINVTSPTGIRELDRQFNIDIAAKLIGAIESKLKAKAA
jgi:glutathione synthase